jgi:hypothetical protein
MASLRGKSHLLRAVAADIPAAIYVPHLQPLRLCLLGLAQQPAESGEGCGRGAGTSMQIARHTWRPGYD